MLACCSLCCLYLLTNKGLDGKVLGGGYLLSVTDPFFLCTVLLLLGGIVEWRNSGVKGEKAAFFDGRSVAGC